ncbi:MAG: sulfotransferase [Chloroflexota bacterium]
MTAEPAGPIFIGGPDRCGKTLVAALLGSHSRIAIPVVGSNVWTLFYGRFGDLEVDANFDRCLAALMAYKHIRFLDPDEARLRQALRRGGRTYARLFAAIQAQHAERLAKPRWGDQTGLVEAYADEIFAAYRGVRMIHMVRDPRDRYDASLSLWPEGKLRAGGATARWLYSVRLAEQNAARYGDSYRIQHYEALVHDPEATIRELCAFVGEAFEPAMMEMGDMPTYRAKLEAGRSRSSAGPLISDAFVGIFRGRLAPAELAFMQSRAGSTMRRHGYALEQVQMGNVARLRYLALDWPLDALRLAAWRARTIVSRIAPRFAGRQPPRRHLA